MRKAEDLNCLRFEIMRVKFLETLSFLFYFFSFLPVRKAIWTKGKLDSG